MNSKKMLNFRREVSIKINDTKKRRNSIENQRRKKTYSKPTSVLHRNSLENERHKKNNPRILQ